MTDNISFNIPKDGSMPSVEGSIAVAVEGQHRIDENDNIIVRWTFNPVGDDALHGGSLEVVATLTKPDHVPQSDKSVDEQATIGANYARCMVESAEHILGTHLSDAFGEAVGEAVKQTKPRAEEVERMANTCMMIATMLLIMHNGDREKAKAEADLRTNASASQMARDAGLTDEMIALATDTIREAIDLADYPG
jgi:hypothetical protein